MSNSLLHSFLFFDRLLSRQRYYHKSICIWLSALIDTFFKFRNFKLLFLFTSLLRYKHTCITTSLFRLAELILKLKFEINSNAKKKFLFLFDEIHVNRDELLLFKVVLVWLLVTYELNLHRDCFELERFQFQRCPLNYFLTLDIGCLAENWLKGKSLFYCY